MNVILLTAILDVIGLAIETPNTYLLDPDYNEYRAAKYSFPVNYSLAQEIMGYAEPSSDRLPRIINAFHYYIQYGNDTFIEILDPGLGNEFMGIVIKRWDYINGKTEFIHYMDMVKKYSIRRDSIEFSIYDNRGIVTNLCNTMPAASVCDSVRIVTYSGDSEYRVCFNDTIPNLAFNSLFFPDIKFLPTRIFGLGWTNATMTLEEVISGKTSVDSLVQLFTFENYSLITDEDRNQISEQEVNDLIDKFERLTKH